MTRTYDQIRLYRTLECVTNPKYKFLHFLITIIFYKDKRALAFNQDSCCHLALCLWLILFHYYISDYDFGHTFLLLKSDSDVQETGLSFFKFQIEGKFKKYCLLFLEEKHDRRYRVHRQGCFK
jgi:hypothetical protein